MAVSRVAFLLLPSQGREKGLPFLPLCQPSRHRRCLSFLSRLPAAACYSLHALLPRPFLTGMGFTTPAFTLVYLYPQVPKGKGHCEAFINRKRCLQHKSPFLPFHHRHTRTHAYRLRADMRASAAFLRSGR